MGNGGGELDDLGKIFLPIVFSEKEELILKYVIKNEGGGKYFNHLTDILQDDDGNWELVKEKSRIEPYSGIIVLKVKKNIASFEVPFETVTGKKLSLYLSAFISPTLEESKKMYNIVSDDYFFIERQGFVKKENDTYVIKKGAFYGIKNFAELKEVSVKIYNDVIFLKSCNENELYNFFKKYNPTSFVGIMFVGLKYKNNEVKIFNFVITGA